MSSHVQSCFLTLSTCRSWPFQCFLQKLSHLQLVRGAPQILMHSTPQSKTWHLKFLCNVGRVGGGVVNSSSLHCFQINLTSSSYPTGEKCFFRLAVKCSFSFVERFLEFLGRIKNSRLGSKVQLSPSTCASHTQEMHKYGYICSSSLPLRTVGY